jgi:serine/threonine protein kinase
MTTKIKTHTTSAQERAFFYFLRHSRLTLLSDDSAYGLVFKCTFIESPEKSPYVCSPTNPHNIDLAAPWWKRCRTSSAHKAANPVIHLIIKLAIVSTHDTTLDIRSHGQRPIAYNEPTLRYLRNNPPIKTNWNYVSVENANKIIKKNIDTVGNFIQECETQNMISQSLHTTNIVYSALYDGLEFIPSCRDRWFRKKRDKHVDQLRAIFRICLTMDDPTQSAIRQLYSTFHALSNPLMPIPLSSSIKEHEWPTYRLSMMCMKYIESPYTTFCSIIKPIIFDEIKSQPQYKHVYKHDARSLSKCSSRLRTTYNIARYAVLMLALDTGYTHGDFHTDNLLIDEEAQTVVFVDFGNAIQIPSIEAIRELWRQLESTHFSDPVRNYAVLVNIMTQIFHTTFSEHRRKHDEYTWCKDMESFDAETIIDQYLRKKLTS